MKEFEVYIYEPEIEGAWEIAQRVMGSGGFVNFTDGLVVDLMTSRGFDWNDRDQILKLSGAWLRGCIAGAIQYFLDQGLHVYVDLQYCIDFDEKDGNTTHTVEERKILLLYALYHNHGVYADSPLLKIITK